MRVEAICSGDELLNGTISDTNSAAFARLLQSKGVELSRTTVVGDAQQDIVDAIKEASARSDLVLVSGGLGPTDDDRTAAAFASAAGVKLVENAEALSRLTARLKRFGRTLTPNNARQALVPSGCTVLQSDVGTAPGFTIHIGGAQCFAMPGVPSEAMWFMEKFIVPWVAERSSDVVSMVTLKCFGIGESDVDNAVKGMEQAFPGISLHFRTTFPENHLKIVARGKHAPDVAALLHRAAQDAHRRLGAVVFSDDGRDFGRVVLDTLLAATHTVAAAESCTGGLLQKLLTDQSGASAAFLGGVVTYANSAKTRLLGVPDALLQQHGAVSAQVAEHMAASVREQLGATWGLGITGIAGPDGGSAEKPVGTVWIGLSGPKGTTSQRMHFPWDRERVRTAAAHHALWWLRKSVVQPA